MQSTDVSSLLSLLGFSDPALHEAALAEDVYQACDGLQYRLEDKEETHIQDIVRLSDHGFFFASNCLVKQETLQHQVINGSDWVHIQFRVSGGGGHETISKTNVVKTPEKSCVVLRYPEHSVIERYHDRSENWRVACLFISPKALTDFLDVPASRLPESAAWMGAEDQTRLHASVMPLQPSMSMAINDVLSCPFRGGTRRAYMRAKSLELLSTVIHSLEAAHRAPSRPVIRLSAFDLDKLAQARLIMSEALDSTMTLAQLARRVGLNRTKLALGFKELYGTSVQAHWRDIKLCRARELLSRDASRVTEIALDMGYSELSSFTRAFSRKFGMLPRDCKSTGRSGACKTV